MTLETKIDLDRLFYCMGFQLQFIFTPTIE